MSRASELIAKTRGMGLVRLSGLPLFALELMQKEIIDCMTIKLGRSSAANLTLKLPERETAPDPEPESVWLEELTEISLLLYSVSAAMYSIKYPDKDQGEGGVISLAETPIPGKVPEQPGEYEEVPESPGSNGTVSEYPTVKPGDKEKREMAVLIHNGVSYKDVAEQYQRKGFAVRPNTVAIYCKSFPQA